MPRRRGSFSEKDGGGGIIDRIPSRIMLSNAVGGIPNAPSSGSSWRSGGGSTRRKAVMGSSVVVAATLATLSFVSVSIARRDVRALFYDDAPTENSIGRGRRYPNQRASNATYNANVNDPLSRYYDYLEPCAIRSWGCHLQTTPLIFVHVGKAGGGSVRARFAASALNYTRGKNKKSWTRVTDNSYYDLDERHDKGDDSAGRRAYFCNSGHANRRPTLDSNTFEGQQLCKAVTPIGRSVACPEPTHVGEENKKRCKIPGCSIDDEHCHQVYVGHNAIGSEFHWLPPKVLHKFWDSISMHNADSTASVSRHPDDVAYIDRAMRSLDPENKEIWCRGSHRGPASFRPHNVQEYKSLYNQCSKPLAASVDEKAIEVLDSRLPRYDAKAEMASWSPVYASLPVLRTTVVREPFSWLVSKYFWHYNKFFKGTKCGDPDTDWMDRFAIEYMLKLCGEDCYVRREILEEDFDSLAFQAEGNLRHSFAVVGLINETDVFYDMVTARVAYVNMSRNLHVQGQAHSTQKRKDYTDCQELFAKQEFQNAIMAKHRAVSLLVHLFKVAVQVNRHQMKELKGCSGGIF